LARNNLYLYSFVVMVVVVVAVVVTEGFSYTGGVPLNCGGYKYDINTQTCCADDFGNPVVVNQPSASCCGSAGVYDPAVSACLKVNTGKSSGFSSSIIPKSGPTGSLQNAKLLCSATTTRAFANSTSDIQELIGDGLAEYFFPTNQTCCATTLGFSVIGGANLQCCGVQTYDPNNQVCCSDQREGNVGSNNNVACCGTTPYDVSQQTCCLALGTGTLYTGANLESRCCGGELLDPTTQVCCGRQVQSLGSIALADASCCGTSVYDSSSEACCIGSLQGPQAVSNVAEATQKGINLRYPVYCCGNKNGNLAYNPAHSRCCSSSSTPSLSSLNNNCPNGG